MGGRPVPSEESENFVVLHPGPDAVSWIHRQWERAGGPGVVVVVTAQPDRARDLVRRMGPPCLEMVVAEGKRRGRLSELLYTSREVRVVSGRSFAMPRKGRVLVWCREGRRGEVAGDWEWVLEDMQRMADGEGAKLEVRQKEGGVRGDGGDRIFGSPLEEDLRWLRCKRRGGGELARDIRLGGG